MVRASLGLVVLTLYIQCTYQIATIFLIKGRAIYYHVCAIMHVKDPQLFVVRVGHSVPVAGLSAPIQPACAEQGRLI